MLVIRTRSAGVSARGSVAPVKLTNICTPRTSLFLVSGPYFASSQSQSPVMRFVPLARAHPSSTSHEARGEIAPGTVFPNRIVCPRFTLAHRLQAHAHARVDRDGDVIGDDGEDHNNNSDGGDDDGDGGDHDDIVARIERERMSARPTTRCTTTLQHTTLGPRGLRDEGEKRRHYPALCGPTGRIKPPKVWAAAASNKRSSLTVLSRIVLSSLGIRQHGRRRRRLPASRSWLRVSHPPLFPPPHTDTCAHTRTRRSLSLQPAVTPIHASPFPPGQPPSLPNRLSPSRSTRAYPSSFAYLATLRRLPI